MWRDGPVVGELVAVGAAKGDGLVGRLRTSCARACAAPSARAPGTGCSPVPAARAPAPRRRSRPSRSRWRRCPACACPEAPAARSPTARWPRAGCWPTTGACRPAAARRSTRSCARRSRCPSRAAPPARSSTPCATRPSPSPASRPGCRSRCRSPSSATTRRRAAAPRRSASTRTAATAPPSPRRAASSASAAAARRRPSSPPRSSTACRSSSPGAPTRLQTLDASRPWLGEGSSAYAGCLFAQDGAAAYRKAYATYVDEPATPLDQRTYDAIGFFAHLSTTGSGVGAPRFADAIARRRWRPGVSGRRARGRRGPVRLVGARACTARRCAVPRLGRQRPLRAAASQRRRPDADRPRQPLERLTLTAPAYAAHPFELFADHSAASAIRVRPPQRPPARRLGGPRRPAQSDAIYCLSRGGRDDQPGDRPVSGGTGGAKATITAIDGGDACAPGRHRDLPHAALPGLRRQLVDSGARPRPTGIRLGPYDNPIPAENAKPGRRRASGTSRAPATADICRASPRTSATTRARPSSSRSHGRPRAYRLDIYRLGWYGGDGRPQGGRDRAGVNPPACSDHAAPVGCYPGLVDCGSWSVSASWTIPPDAISGVYFAHLVGNDKRREPHLLRRAQRPLALGPLLPDVRHHLAGLQRLRRQQPLHGRPADAATPRARQGQLQPALHHPRRPGRPGLDLQRRVPDDPLAGAQRLRRQLRDRRRHRPLRVADHATTTSSCPSATTSTGPVRSAPTSRRRAARA